MNMKPLRPIKRSPKAEVQVDLKDAETIRCKNCNNYIFVLSYVLKKLSAILSPTGEAALIPVQVYSCGNCGIVAEGFIEKGLIEELEGDEVEETGPREDALFRADL